VTRSDRFVAIDLGTTFCKAAAFDAQGRRRGLGRAPCAVSRPQLGWVEQEPDEWWRAATAALQGLWATGVDPEAVAAVGLSGHFSTAFVDAGGRSVRPAITWLDGRAVAEAEWLETEVGPDRLRRALGIDLPISAAMPHARLLWLARHEPRSFGRLAATYQAKDYLVERLTGERATDRHSELGLLNIATGKADAEYLALLGLRPEQVPPPSDPFAVVGAVTSPAARATGLRPGTKVVCGWIDAYCAMLGTGLGEGGTAFDIAGTSEVVGTQGCPQPGGDARGQLIIPLTADRTVIYALMSCGADSLAWVRDLVGRPAYATALREAAAVPSGADGVLFLPYLEGERSPVWDAGARGCFVGLHRSHGRGHAVRAVLEGVAHAIRQNLAGGQAAGAFPLEGVRLSGGGAQARLWCRIKADVLGLPVTTTAESETGALGAAMLAAIGAGAHADFPAAVRAMVRTRDSYRPDPAAHEAHSLAHERYLRLYAATREAG